MKRLLALALPLLALAGCHPHGGPTAVCHNDFWGDRHCHDGYHYTPHDHSHDTTTIVTTSANNGGGDNNIIIVEETYSQCMWEPPYYGDPEYCTFDGGTCCMWLNIGSEEQWCYYDYCGWELVAVYSYYQEEERDEV